MVVEITTIGPAKQRSPSAAIRQQSPSSSRRSVPTSHNEHPAAYINRSSTSGPPSTFNVKINKSGCWHLDGKALNKDFGAPRDDGLVANKQQVRINKRNYYSQLKQSTQKHLLDDASSRALPDVHFDRK
eukprot:PhF_6_TR9144/c0_g1_i2/m.14221